MRLPTLIVATALAASPALAQKIIDGTANGAPRPVGIVTAPSVDAGIADGSLKQPGSPSVGDGRANGVVKGIGAPSVGDGLANGVVKSTTVNQ